MAAIENQTWVNNYILGLFYFLAALICYLVMFFALDYSRQDSLVGSILWPIYLIVNCVT
ncbi:MAG: hypothetical protein LBE38_08425 [Deltaproteobacteria bacterium]|nr:hypothetical protein [Deltaproteobacteria bacterium]